MSLASMAALNITGTGGIIEGNLQNSNVNVNLDAPLVFNGTNTYIDASTAEGVFTEDMAYTFSCWFKTASGTVSGGAERNILLSVASTDGNTSYLRIGVDRRSGAGTSNPGLFYSDDRKGDVSAVGSANSLNDQSWHHVAFVRTAGAGGQNTIPYVDGVAGTTISATDPQFTAGDKVYIGMEPDGGSASDLFAGNIADVRVYNSALGATEIETLASKIGVDNSVVQSSDTRVLHYDLTVRDSTSTCAETVTSGDETDDNIDTSEYRNFTNGDYVLIDDEIIGPLSAVGDSGNLVGIPAGSSGRALFGTSTAEHSSGDKIFIVNIDDLSTNSNLPTLVGDLTTPSGDLDFDAFSVNVQDNSTTTDGAVTVTQGKLEGLGLTSVPFDGGSDYINTGLDTNAYSTFSVSAWVKADSFTNYDTIIGTNVDNNQDEGWGLARGNSNDYVFWVDLYSDSAKVSFTTTGKWIHLIGTYDGTNQKIYLDGVLQDTEADTWSNKTATDVLIGSSYGSGGSATGYPHHGNIRDVRIYKDIALSDNQCASLYSGSFNVTPTHWWKLDEGHATAGLSNAVGAYSDSGTGTASHGQGVSLVANTNGTLNLDAILTIETGGTLSAPRGNLDLGLSGSGNLLVRNGSGVFKHNNGKLRHTTANTGTIGTDFTGTNAFYDLEVSDAGGNISFDGGDIDIEHDTTGGPGNIKIYDNCTVTAGTDSHSCEWTNDTIFGMSSGAGGTYPRQTLQAKSQLKPINYNPASGTTYWSEATLDGAIAAGRYFAVKWINWKQALVIPYNANLTLLGDCSFEGNVTVDADDDAGGAHVAGRLDMNGERAEIAGTLDVNGTIYNTAGSTSKPGQIWGNAIQTTASNNADDLDLISDGGYFDADPTTHRNIFMRSGTHTIGGARDFGPSPLFVGGTTNFNSNNTWGDITIATGGEFQGDGTVVTCEGDFTTSGGLLGASCMDQGITATRGDAADALRISGDRTIEFWVKYPSSDRPSGGSTYNFVQKTSYGYYVALDENGKVKAGIQSGASTSVTSATSIDDNKWHHVAWVFDQSTADTGHKIYIDGKLDAQATSGAGSTGEACTFTVGTGRANVYMDEVRLWDDVRTQTEIRNNMFTEVTSGAIAVYNFNEGSGGTAEDAIGSLDLTLSTTGEWPAAGSLTWTGGATPSAGTLIMNSGSAQTMNIPAATRFFNLTSSGSGATTIDTQPYIYGLLESSGANIFCTGQLGISGTTTPTVSGTTFVNIASFVYQAGAGDTTVATATTYNTLRGSNNTPVRLGGATIATDVHLDSTNVSLTTMGNNLTTKTVNNSGTLTLSADTTLTFTDLSGCGFGSSSGTLVSAGTEAEPNTITSSGTPTNYWSTDSNSMSFNADFTTFDKSNRVLIQANKSQAIDNCTFTNGKNNQIPIYIAAPAPSSLSFTNNTITANTSSDAFRSDIAHTGFDNIVITNAGAGGDVYTNNVKLEFTNSNFDVDEVTLNGSAANVISKTHNDTENLYEILAGSGALTYSTIANPFGTDADVKLRAGILTMNQDNKVCDTFNVFSGATIRVSDNQDLYVQGAFDNDGTWVQTAGYGGEIHVGDFTPFDSGDILDNTDFVDTGFHDTSHYLEMDL